MTRNISIQETRRETAFLWLVSAALCLGLAQVGSAEEIHDMGEAPWSASKLKLNAVPSVVTSQKV
jgi:hypothetical protein